MTLGEKITQIRKGAQLSQEQFGQMLGVSRQSVSKWESDLAQPELKTIVEMSKTFGVSLDELLKDEKNDNSFERLMKKKMLFQLGCICIFVGTILMCFFLYLQKDMIIWYGSVIQWLIRSFTTDADYPFEVIIAFAVICIGVYICYNSQKDNK